jgi:hypothetical protein
MGTILVLVNVSHVFCVQSQAKLVKRRLQAIQDALERRSTRPTSSRTADKSADEVTSQRRTILRNAPSVEEELRQLKKSMGLEE